MKKIVRLTVSSFFGPLLVTFLIVLFTLLLQFLWKYIDDLVGKGLEWYVILQLLIFASASFVPLALPLSILLSSIMSFGKLSETYELVALKSAGVSLVRALIPLTVIVTLITIGAFFFTNDAIPRANLKFYSLLWDVRNQRPALDIKEGVFYGGIDNYIIRINKKDKDGRHIHDIMIYDHTRLNRGNEIVLTAKSGEMYTSPDKRYLTLQLYDGARYEEMLAQSKNNVNGQRFEANRLMFKSYEIKFDLSGFNLRRTQEELFKDNYQMLNVNQLSYYSDSLEQRMRLRMRDTRQFISPYLSILRDSALLMAPPLAGPAMLPPPANEAWVFALPRFERRETMSRAMGIARSIKETFRVQREEMRGYREQHVKYEMEWHRKFAISLACLTMFFIGAPLGAVIRKGGIGAPTVAAIIMFVVYYILTKVGEQMAASGTVSIFWGMWGPTFILLPMGFYLIHRANIDRINYNIGSNIRFFFTRLFKRFGKRSRPKTA